MIIFRQCILAFVSLLLISTGSRAAPTPIPGLQSRVTDLTATLTPAQCQKLEDTLRQFESTKGSQVVVLVIPSTGEETIEQYGIRVADQWKIGRHGINDGVILLVAKNDHTLRIEVGRGLEGALPDVTASRIINEIIVPFFKNGDFPGGIEAGIDRIIKVIQGEPLPAPAMNRSPGTKGSEPLAPFLGVGIPIVMILLSSLIGRLAAGLIGGTLAGIGTYWLIGSWIAGAVIGVLFFLLIILITSAKIGSGQFGTGAGNWSCGGSNSGSFSGGGGSFGGGGASGRW